ncbi:hypothetical protein H2204_013052 [Knufia peltigerae]|uniref:Uncharacterized protein n=1 Tax=Knufia peltigerae TaxID=1002370 RepID=A0AA39CSD0_9EURO|nr:hypothetical protein H2204_013052 [Knufia peltigerae]
MSSLAGKVFAVTGAASGIGRSTAEILLSRGAKVSFGDIDVLHLEETRALRQPQAPERTLFLHLDVADRQSVREFVEKTLKHFGHLDGLAHVAGIAGNAQGPRKIWELENSQFRLIHQVNVEGTFNCLGEALKPGVMSDGGSIVNVSSYAGIHGLPGISGYSSSKHAVIGLTRCAAIEAAPRNIRVNVVTP